MQRDILGRAELTDGLGEEEVSLLCRGNAFVGGGRPFHKA